MSDPFLGEIRMFGFGFAPHGWALCNGQLMQINQNQALFAILGTTYGGDGQVTFALPNLQGRVPLHFGNAIALGQNGGSETVTLIPTQLPAHTHTLVASTDPAVAKEPTSNALANKPQFGADVFATPAAVAPLHPQSLGFAGGSQPHENMQPFGVLSFAIALVGIFPSRN